MRTCCKCGVSFEPTSKKIYQCPACWLEYNRRWRAKRRAEGKKACGNRMPLEYERARSKVYFAEPENRERRNANARRYSKAPGTREHHQARSLVHSAIACGRLTRQPCQVCGATPAEAHHDDYSRPLDVRWLCPAHHREHHAQTRAEGRTP